MHRKVKITIVAGCSIMMLVCAMFFIFISYEKKEALLNDVASPDSDGVLYNNVSDYVDVTVYPACIFADENQKKIRYSFAITNKSKYELNNFRVTIKMNPELDLYLAAGTAPFPITPVNLASPLTEKIAGDQGYGVDINFTQLLSSDTFYQEAGLQLEDIFKYAEDISLEIAWDSGEEEFLLKTSVLNDISNK